MKGEIFSYGKDKVYTMAQKYKQQKSIRVVNEEEYKYQFEYKTTPDRCIAIYVNLGDEGFLRIEGEYRQ